MGNIRKEELRKSVYQKSDVTSLLQDGLEKVITGITSIDEILRVIDVDDDFGESDADLKAALIGNIASVESLDTSVNPSDKQIVEPTEAINETVNQTTVDANFNVPDSNEKALPTPEEFVNQFTMYIPAMPIDSRTIETL